ncbi:hypothetical protein [Leisingera sp. F5]|uniref:hypothetical protein n=1 Tax=Leisingera sp. F5 TaxID=1813816 RepID=UPI000A4CCF5D|nr:hypothetical protein [Leisingera sp. F5]
MSPLIDALRAGAGETAAAMAQTIIQKRAEYRVFYGAMTANRRRLDALIAAAATLEDLAAVDLAEGWRLGA